MLPLPSWSNFTCVSPNTPSAPGVCSQCVCVHCCVGAFGWVNAEHEFWVWVMFNIYLRHSSSKMYVDVRTQLTLLYQLRQGWTTSGSSMPCNSIYQMLKLKLGPHDIRGTVHNQPNTHRQHQERTFTLCFKKKSILKRISEISTKSSAFTQALVCSIKDLQSHSITHSTHGLPLKSCDDWSFP